MGRPRELTKQEREKLMAEGYRPVEVWVPDIWSDELWAQIDKDCEAIRNSEERADINLWIEEGARETMRRIQEMEETGR